MGCRYLRFFGWAVGEPDPPGSHSGYAPGNTRKKKFTGLLTLSLLTPKKSTLILNHLNRKMKNFLKVRYTVEITYEYNEIG